MKLDYFDCMETAEQGSDVFGFHQVHSAIENLRSLGSTLTGHVSLIRSTRVSLRHDVSAMLCDRPKVVVLVAWANNKLSDLLNMISSWICGAQLCHLTMQLG